MSKLKIRVLGALAVEDKGTGEISLPRKYKAVLSALALAGTSGLSREKLVDLFWRDHGERQAQASLRQALASIRKGLGTHRHCLLADRGQIAIEDGMISLDATEFEALASSEQEDDRALALELYKGDLLDGVRLKEEGFEAWLRPMRERLRGKAIALLSESLHGASDTEISPNLALRLLELEPTNEIGHRALMRSYAAQGRNNAALKQFIICRDILNRELDVGPSRQTVVLYQEIKSKRSQFAESGATGGEQLKHDIPPTLPDKPSIAVLPFDNMSGDPEQEYFADGITEDIITLFSKLRWLFVIARNSTFRYKGTAPDIRQIGQDLDVRYVLEGSVRKVGNRVRITAQLIDTSNGRQIWAENYDRQLKDVFALQDDITRQISACLEPEIERAEWRGLGESESINLGSWDQYLRGLARMHEYSREGYIAAKTFFQEAVELEPEFGHAHAALAYVMFHDITDGYVPSREEAMRDAEKHALTAVTADDQDAFAHCILGRVYSIQLRFDEAISALQFAIKLNPSLALAHHGLGYALLNSGEAEQSIPFFETAERLSPHDHNVWAFLGIRAQAYIELGDYAAAVVAAREAVRKPHAKIWANATLVSALGHAGAKEGARKALDELLRRKPDFNARFIRETLIRNDREKLEHFIDGLRKAGLPE